MSASTQLASKPVSNVPVGPSQLALDEWAALGLRLPDMEAMRSYRRERIIAEIVKNDLGGLLCFDPLNIRYITDCPNMQIWTARNPCRAVFVSAGGHIVLWEFHHCTHLSDHLPLIDELRSGAGARYFQYGDATHAVAAGFAAEVSDVLQAHAQSNRRLAVDRTDTPVLLALQQAGIAVEAGQCVTEQARLIKSEDEIAAMRCAVATGDAAVGEMHAHLRAGISENELWSHLHAGIIKRGGEWIETRLLSSGPRTNPWFHECGGRVLENGDLVAFDTDLIANYGMCVDFSRTWLVGDGAASDHQRELFAVAHDYLAQNIALLQPGSSYTEISRTAPKLPERFEAQRYPMVAHGLGVCDEFPSIADPGDEAAHGCTGELAPGMILSVEAYVGAVGGSEGVKLEDMVLITQTGHEILSQYPFDARLAAGCSSRLTEPAKAI